MAARQPEIMIQKEHAFEWVPISSSLIWFTVVISIVTDALLIVVLLFELDRVQIPIRGVSYASLLACFVNFVLFAADFAIYLRIWMAQQRAASTDSATYDFPSYGSP
ncbi:unnamed protein product [Heligmosomoides polygyrus]|uniref:G_PROTEIN_RECEP_F1_2 domain-containing protein n=1 Tax=Heligmosomoides polygyrus TaxID=6339 RepID=A0A183GC91_HELPZ|nr:unnamed protein product [Heligmosomoides polygyrus]